MRHAAVASGCVLTLLGVAAVCADGVPDSELAAPLCLHAAGRPIDTKAVHAAPCVGDWNGDGRPDLLLGEAAGRLHLYRNAGSPGAPRLVDGGLVEAEGEPVHVPPG